MAPAVRLLTLFSGAEKRRLIGVAVLIFLGGLLEVGAAGLLVPYFLLLQNPNIIQEDPRVATLYDALEMSSPTNFIVLVSAVLLLYFVMKNAYLSRLAFLQAKFVAEKQCSLTRRLFSAYMRAPYAFHLKHNSAELQNTSVLQAFSGIPKLMSAGLVMLAELLVLIMLSTLLLIVRPLPTIAVGVLVGSLALVFYRAVRRRLDSLGRGQIQSSEDAIKWLNQAFGGMKETKAFRLEKFFIEELASTTKVRSENQYQFTAISQLPRFFIETMMVCVLFVLVIVMLLQGYDNDALLSGLVLFGAVAFRVMPSGNRIATNLGTLKYFLPAVEPVCRDLTLLEGIEEARPDQQGGDWAPARLGLSNAITVERVSFTYPDSGEAVLKDVSLEIKKGTSVAIVGPSGSGKTTLVDLLLGLFEPETGRIVVDGADIGENLSAWRGMVGYVPQNVYLCDDSVRRNIAFGVPDDEIDGDRMRSVLAAAQLDSVVEGMPEGLDTKIGERGIRLSGGERQRLGIARALYRGPAVLVLDEATSSLDYGTENEVTRALEGLKGSVTIIVVAHRLSAVKGCHEIYSLRSGVLEGEIDYAVLAKSQDVANQGSVTA